MSSAAAARARAPGKVVLSGAYAVLEGSRAIVAAVDRYVIADATRPAELVTPELKAALGEAQAAPWFDASALREGERKLGLGSSAAILAASLGARELATEPSLDAAELRRRVFPVALAAHRRAQGGGSGIDVAASVHGGVLLAQRDGQGLRLQNASLPSGLRVSVLAAETSASTPALLASVRQLQSDEPQRYARLMGAQAEASERAAAALLAGEAQRLVDALAAQGAALAALGYAAGVSIVTPALARCAAPATAAGAALLPAGAGGGDVALWVSANDAPVPADAELRSLPLQLGAAGLDRAPA